jgi:hypothetical protein
VTKIPGKNNLKKERFILLSDFLGDSVHDRLIMGLVRASWWRKRVAEEPQKANRGRGRKRPRERLTERQRGQVIPGITFQDIPMMTSFLQLGPTY